MIFFCFYLFSSDLSSLLTWHEVSILMNGYDKHVSLCKYVTGVIQLVRPADLMFLILCMYSKLWPGQMSGGVGGPKAVKRTRAHWHMLHILITLEDFRPLRSFSLTWRPCVVPYIRIHEEHFKTHMEHMEVITVYQFHNNIIKTKNKKEKRNLTIAHLELLHCIT